MGTQLHPPKGAQQPSPIFSTHVHCDQTVVWIGMPLGMEVGLGPSNIVLDGDLAPPHKKGHSGKTQRSAFSAVTELLFNLQVKVQGHQN